jgi:tripartite-type tricarboxylate transporter receptor subunit TctC
MRLASVVTLTLAAIAEQCGFPRPACGERATRAERKPKHGPVRGRLHKLRLAEAPPHPDLLPASGEKETAVRPGNVRSRRWSHNTSRMVWLASWLAAMLVIAPALRAEPVADFYRGKTIKVIIGYAPGGGYDLYGRLAAEFLGRHIPGNPTIVAENMPGGGSLKAILHLYSVAPQDGTVLGSVSQQLAMNAVTDEKNKMDVARLHYIGRFTSNIDVGVALPRAGIKTFEDARRREVVVGADNGSMALIYARALNTYGGARLKIVKGYIGSADIQLAAERGEVDINGSFSLPAVLAAHADWVRGGTGAILYQNALKRFPQLPQVPTLSELMLTDEGRTVARVVAGMAEIGRSILTTPGVPADRLAALRTGFQDMLKDPDFVSACSKRNLMLEPARGEDMDAINQETMNLPKPIVEALRTLLKE